MPKYLRNMSLFKLFNTGWIETAVLAGENVFIPIATFITLYLLFQLKWFRSPVDRALQWPSICTSEAEFFYVSGWKVGKPCSSLDAGDHVAKTLSFMKLFVFLTSHFSRSLRFCFSFVFCTCLISTNTSLYFVTQSFGKETHFLLFVFFVCDRFRFAVYIVS